VSNSSIRVSESLMAALQRAADVKQRSPEEVVEDAVERYLRLSRRKRLFAGCLHWASSGRGRTECDTPYPSRQNVLNLVAAAFVEAASLEVGKSPGLSTRRKATQPRCAVALQGRIDPHWLAR
jgi:predicted transcriptional regulator